MTRRAFTQHLRSFGCIVALDGRSHTVWQSPTGTAFATLPFAESVPAALADTVCAALGIPPPPPLPTPEPS